MVSGTREGGWLGGEVFGPVLGGGGWKKPWNPYVGKSCGRTGSHLIFPCHLKKKISQFFVFFPPTCLPVKITGEHLVTLDIFSRVK